MLRIAAYPITLLLPGSPIDRCNGNVLRLFVPAKRARKALPLNASESGPNRSWDCAHAGYKSLGSGNDSQPDESPR